MVKKEIDAKLKIMPTQEDDAADNSPYMKVKPKSNNSVNSTKQKRAMKRLSSTEPMTSPNKPASRTPQGGKRPTQEQTALPEDTRKNKSQKSISRKVKPKKAAMLETKSQEMTRTQEVDRTKPIDGENQTQDASGNSSRVTLSDLKLMEQKFGVLDCFHGYICREDLPGILKKFGDYLIRISVHMSTSEKHVRLKRKKSARIETRKESREVLPSTMLGPDVIATSSVDRDYVVSVYSRSKERGANGKKRNMIRNLAVKTGEGQFFLELGRNFKTLPELLIYYKTNVGMYKTNEFQLLNPIGLSSWEYKHKEVELLERKLGEGAFGEVREARLKLRDGTDMKVAVKMLKNADNVNREQVTELLHEARLMRGLDHKNVLRAYGVAVLSEPLYLMSELCSAGALREYLKENAKTITLTDKLMFCLGSARGVEYLHSQKLIHRDLAVRNVLLTDDKTPKIADFGLAKMTDRYEMKEACKIPVRYLAPETLETFTFTLKSDVFSFGMVVWEIYENGTQPHDGKNAQTIREMTKKNQFLKINEAAPTQLRKFVTDKIFVPDPENRCNMSAVVQQLEKITIKEGK